MLNIQKAENLTKPTSLRILYGNPGMGKTTTIQFMPGKKLVIDIDGTSSVLKGKKNIDVLTISNFDNISEDFPKILQEIKQTKLNDYDSIAIDNLSELENAYLTQMGKMGKNKGVPELGHYQRLQFWELNMIRYLKSFKKEILLTAWEQTDQYIDENTGQTIMRAYPQIRKPILTNVMGLCLQVGRIMVDPKSKQRYINLTPDNFTFAKNQIDDSNAKLPQQLFE